VSDFLKGHPTKSGILEKDWGALEKILIFKTEKKKDIGEKHHK